MKKKRVAFPNAPGFCDIPMCTEDNMHEFGLYDSKGNQLSTGYFSSMESAITKAKEVFPNNDHKVLDLDEEWYIKTAIEYRKRIKKLHPSFKITNIIIDLSEMYYSRKPNDWYTFIPFSYNNNNWCYRETASDEWLEKLKDLDDKTSSLEEKINAIAPKTLPHHKKEEGIISRN